MPRTASTVSATVPATFQRAGVTLRASVTGPANAPVALLLHGFPEDRSGWRKQVQPLAQAGFRVVVPDQRGYGLSSKPRGITAYALPQLTDDIAAIIGQLGADRVCLAGHDWGGIVAWSVALRYPHLIQRLAILNAPHPFAMRRLLQTSARQMLRSWYALFFQLPWLPERLIRANHCWLARNALLRSSRPGTFSATDLDRYATAWSQPGALTAMIHWYRAFLRTPHGLPRDPAVRVPTRIIWGDRDAFLLPQLARMSAEYCSEGDLIRLPRATHWVQHEEPAAVNNALREWFAS